jgi:hypothetical protein
MSIHLKISETYNYSNFYYEKVPFLSEFLSTIRNLSTNPVQVEMGVVNGYSVVIISCPQIIDPIEFLEAISGGLKSIVEIISPMLDITYEDSDKTTFVISGLNQFIGEIYEYATWVLSQ